MENAEPTPLRYAGFWRRSTAYTIDQHIVALLAYFSSELLGAVANAQDAAQNLDQLVKMGWVPAPGPGQSINDILVQSGASGSPLISGWDVAIFLTCSFFYHVWFTAGGWQGTPGKHWCGIKVIREMGGLITLKMSAIRWFARFMSWFTAGLGFLLIAFSRQKVSMHDAICGTRVVYRR